VTEILYLMVNKIGYDRQSEGSGAVDKATKPAAQCKLRTRFAQHKKAYVVMHTVTKN
jgi:hypothetical protein